MTAEAPDSLQDMDAGQQRKPAASLMRTLESTQQELTAGKTLNEKLIFEIAMLPRFRFGKRGEQLPPGVQYMPAGEEAVDEDLLENEAQLTALNPKADPVATPKDQPKRAALPPELPRIESRHEPLGANCTCGCVFKFVRNEVSEKLDYMPGAFEDLQAVVYDFTEGRAGAHAREFFGDWAGSLVCDD